MEESSPFEETIHVKQLVVEGTEYFFRTKKKGAMATGAPDILKEEVLD